MVINYLWLIEMASRNERIPSDPFRLRKIEPPSIKDHNGSIKLPKKNSGPRTRFTLRELIKIFKVVQEYPSKKNKNQVYWQRFIRNGFFPGRSVNSVNAQWQRFCHYDTIEQAIQKAY